MKAKDLREKSIDELKKQLLDLFREQFNLRMQKGGETARPHLFTKVRRSIARIKTLINEKEVRS